MDIRLATYYNVWRPEFGPHWDIQLTLKLLFPK
jgi:hypothetical protein